jgi:hypothetical protein
LVRSLGHSEPKFCQRRLEISKLGRQQTGRALDLVGGVIALLRN